MIEHHRQECVAFSPFLPPQPPIEDDDTLVTICCRTLGSNFNRFDLSLLFLSLALLIRSLPASLSSKLASLPAPLLPHPLSCEVNGPL